MMKTLYRIYFWLPNFSRFGIFGKVINLILRKILKRALDSNVASGSLRVRATGESGLNNIPRSEQYIVSLTSFPARIADVWITIETIFAQTYKADKVILWLDQKQFEGLPLPDKLLKLQERGLTISFCDDVRSHTKYFYAIQKFPNSNIITLDDDSYYPETIIEKLVDLHQKWPTAICANRVHKMVFNGHSIAPYRKWFHNYKGIKTPNHLLVQTGVSGVLYPPNSLHPDVFEKEIFSKICFYADDLWLKVHTLRQGTKVVVSDYFNKDLISVSATQNENLVSQNSFAGGNDEQLNNVCEHYNIDLATFRG